MVVQRSPKPLMWVQFLLSLFNLHGGIGEGVNTLVCGSSMRGFESHIPPHNGGLAQLGEHLPYKQEVTGSSPVSSIESLAQLVEHLTFNQRVGSSSLPRLIGPEKLKRVWRNWQTR